MSLNGKVALVTGGGSGIGAAIARSLASEGAKVAIADLNGEAAIECAKSLQLGPRAMPLAADCGDVAQIRFVFGEVLAGFGRLDILVNNAGLTVQSSLLQIDEQEWDLINRVNLKGAFFCLQAAAKQMRDQGSGGRIINIASISGRGYPDAANGAYVASKGGLISLTAYAAHQLAPHDINVNAICPGITRTPLLLRTIEQRAALAKTTSEDILHAIEAKVPLGRVNAPEDIAAMAVFLSGEGGRNITGQAFNVDGGLVTS